MVAQDCQGTKVRSLYISAAGSFAQGWPPPGIAHRSEKLWGKRQEALARGESSSGCSCAKMVEAPVEVVAAAVATVTGGADSL